MKKLIFSLSIIMIASLETVFASDLKLPNQMIGLCKEGNGLGYATTFDSGKGNRYAYTCTVDVYDIDSFNQDQAKSLSDNFYSTSIIIDKRPLNSGIYRAFIRQIPASNVDSSRTIALRLYAECVPKSLEQECDADIFNTLKSKYSDLSNTKAKLIFNPAPPRYDRCGGYGNEPCDDGRGYIGG